MIEEVQPPQTTNEDILHELLTPPEPGFYESPGPLPFNKIKSIIGPPPVLSTEDAEAYNSMLLYYMKSVEPKDFLLQMLVKDLVDADWESLRIKRHKAWAIERKDRFAREIEARRIKTAGSKRTVVTNTEKPDDERLFELQCEVDDLSKDAIEAIKGSRKPSRDIDLSHAMEEGINYYERLDKLEKDSLAKRVIILEQIRLYNETLYLKSRRYYDYMDATETERLKRLGYGKKRDD
jgi:hypothetical protein